MAMDPQRGHFGRMVRVPLAAVSLALIAWIVPGVAPAQSPLTTWSDRPVRAAIVDFVERVTTAGSPEFVPRDERIATFDMDGTVITEKPASAQKLIAMAQVCVLGTNEPQRKDQSPFWEACAEDYAYFPGFAGSRTLRDLLTGQTEAAFRSYAGKYLKLAKHPGFDRKVGDMAYAPMLELARYLRENGFGLYLVSGSSQPLVREFAARLFNLEDSHGIGTEWPLEFVANPGPRSEPVFRWSRGEPRLPSVFGPGKPLAILRHIGRPPIFAAGNSMGDFEMLQYATGRRGPGMGLVIVHDDAHREYSYADSGIEAAAMENGWSLVSMKNDFKTVFAD